MIKAISYSRISTEPSDFKIFVPYKKGKRLGGEWFTPRQLGLVIVLTANLAKQHPMKGKIL